MELRLMEHFADLFNREIGGGVDIRKFPKALAKLKKQVKRTKEILSANSEALLSVEGLHDDRDFRLALITVNIDVPIDSAALDFTDRGTNLSKNTKIYPTFLYYLRNP